MVHGSKVDLIIEKIKDPRTKKIHENVKVLRIRDQDPNLKNEKYGIITLQKDVENKKDSSRGTHSMLLTFIPFDIRFPCMNIISFDQSIYE